jgi:hypothetical protein
MPSPELILKILFSLLALFTLSTLFFFLIFFSNRLLRVRADRKHTIRLENRGNCRSMYTLTVSSNEPALRFSLFLKDVPLVEVHEISPDAEQSSGFMADTHSANSPAPAPVKGTAPGSGAASLNTGTAIKSGQAVAAKAGTVASLLGAIGHLLPGSLGAGLRAQSARAREMQTGTSRAIQAPQAIEGRMGAVQKESGKLAGAKPQAPNTAKSSPARAAQSSQKVVQPPSAAASSGAFTAAHPATEAAYRAQTPELAPGQAFDLTLQIGTSTKRYPVGSYDYTVLSQQVALDFPDVISDPVRRHAVAHFGTVNPWRYWLPSFVSILLVLTSAVSLIYAYMLIWGQA